MAERTTRKIGAWVPPDLYDNLKSLGYFGRQDQGEVSQTDTIIEGLTLLFEKASGRQLPQESPQSDDKRDTMENILVQVGELGARNEELERYNATLKGELEQAHRDKETIQGLYDNYMRQMQTLIQQKAIDTGEKRKWWEIWK